jgi:hypothetical protein
MLQDGLLEEEKSCQEGKNHKSGVSHSKHGENKGNKLLDSPKVECTMISGPETRSLVDLLQETALFLWKEWPKDMRAVTLDGKEGFSLIGECPHCRHDSVFVQVTDVYSQWIGQFQAGTQVRLVVALRCQGCLRFVLGMATRIGAQAIRYEEHYPIGSPDDAVAEEIPDHIKPDFQEALRCLWIDAYNATAEMCRRAIEATCLDLGAPKKDVLEDMIDWLAEERIITPGLQKSAHKIRLGGNRGAHPPVGGPSVPNAPPVEPNGPVEKIEKDHALAIVEFTRHFFQHVYVIPKQLDKYDFSKPKIPKATNS